MDPRGATQYGGTEPAGGRPPGAQDEESEPVVAPHTPGGTNASIAHWPPPTPPQAPGTWSPPPLPGRTPARWPAGQEPGPPWPPLAGGDEGARFLDRPGAPPATRGAAWFWLLMGLVGFLVGQIVGTVFVAIAAAVAGESGQVQRFATMAAPPEWYVGTSLVGLWAGFFLGPWIASRARGTGRFLADLGLRFRPIDLVGVALGVGAQFLLDALYAPFISHMKNFTAPTHKLVGASHGWGYLAIAVLTVCGAPFFEEILFRGLAFKALARLFAPLQPGPSRRRAVGLSAAVVVDGVLFGLAHWELYQFAGLALFGMLLAVISYRTNRLGMNIITHASFNLVAVLALVGTSGGVVH